MTPQLKKAILGDLEEVLDYFDNRMDADHDGVDYIPNTEMRMFGMLQNVTNAIRALPAPEKEPDRE